MADISFDRAVAAFRQSTGHLPPSEPFAALITGVAYPQFQLDDRVSSNVRLATPYPTGCTEPAASTQTVDTPGVNGFYPPQVLPCGVPFARYRWIALHKPYTSEGFGLRRDRAGKYITWRQALYALNTFDPDADPKLNYPAVPPGTNVIMAWGPLAEMLAPHFTDDALAPFPGFGFWFHHPIDPGGTFRCPDLVTSGGTVNSVFGCCIIRDAQLGLQVGEFCATQANCLAFTSPGVQVAEWLGPNVNCPINGQICEGLGSGEPLPPSSDCEPAGEPGYQAGNFQAPSLRLVSRFHKIAGCKYGVRSDGTPTLPPVPGEECF